MEDLPQCVICKKMIKLNEHNKIKYPETVIWDGWDCLWIHKTCKEINDNKLFLRDLAVLKSISDNLNTMTG
jgi:hypothetical protein